MRTDDLLTVDVESLTVDELAEFPMGEILRVLKYLKGQNTALMEMLDIIYDDYNL